MFQKAFISGNNYVFVDFYLPKPHKVCIEIDGKYHNTIKQMKRDRNRDFYLQYQRRFKVFHYTNEQIYTNVRVIDEAINYIYKGRKYLCQ